MAPPKRLDVAVAPSKRLGIWVFVAPPTVLGVALAPLKRLGVVVVPTKGFEEMRSY